MNYNSMRVVQGLLACWRVVQGRRTAAGRRGGRATGTRASPATTSRSTWRYWCPGTADVLVPSSRASGQLCRHCGAGMRLLLCGQLVTLQRCGHKPVVQRAKQASCEAAARGASPAAPTPAAPTPAAPRASHGGRWCRCPQPPYCSGPAGWPCRHGSRRKGVDAQPVQLERQGPPRAPLQPEDVGVEARHRQTPQALASSA